MGGTILYLAGGAMSAVFSAGVMAKLQELDVYDDIEAVYAVSAGAVNGAFFLSRQAHLLEQMYCEDLPGCKVINTSNLWTIWHGERKDVFDVDRALDVIISKRILDSAALQHQPIPLFAKVYDLDGDMVEYLDARQHGVFPVLHATSSLAPFYNKAVTVNGKRYIDGAVRESIGLKHLLEQHPDKSIVVVLNTPMRSLRSVFNDLLLRSILRSIDIKHYRLYRLMEEGQLQDLRLAFKEERILLVQPPPEYEVTYTTCEPKMLREGYRHGLKAAERIVRFMQREPLPTLMNSFEESRTAEPI